MQRTSSDGVEGVKVGGMLGYSCRGFGLYMCRVREGGCVDTWFIACADSTYYWSERGFLAVEGGSEEGTGRQVRQQSTRTLCSVPVADGVEEKRTALWVAVLWKLVGGWNYSQNFPKCQFPKCKLPKCQLSNFFRVSSIA